MAVNNLIHFPVSLIVDGILSFLQNRFSNPLMTPGDYRWDPDERQSRIYLSSQYPSAQTKPMQAPAIIVTRGAFRFANQGIGDNLRTADANVFTNPEFQDYMIGTVDVLVESGVPSESSTLAEYIAIEIQANRHGIEKTLGFVKRIMYSDIGPEIPTNADVQVRRWQTVVRFQCHIYTGWMLQSEETIPYNKAELWNIGSPPHYTSHTGTIVTDEATLYDANANFGIYTSNNPQLLQRELSKKWYYVTLGDSKRLYPVDSIIDEHTLKLIDRNKDDVEVPFSASESKDNLTYNVLWNTVHIHVKLPTNT